MIDSHDEVAIVIAIASGVFAALSGITTWLWRHSTRLTRVETRTDGIERAADLDRRRTDAVVQDVRAALIRIEQKIDMKADKP